MSTIDEQVNLYILINGIMIHSATHIQRYEGLQKVFKKCSLPLNSIFYEIFPSVKYPSQLSASSYFQCRRNCYPGSKNLCSCYSICNSVCVHFAKGKKYHSQCVPRPTTRSQFMNFKTLSGA